MKIHLSTLVRLATIVFAFPLGSCTTQVEYLGICTEGNGCVKAFIRCKTNSCYCPDSAIQYFEIFKALTLYPVMRFLDCSLDGFALHKGPCTKYDHCKAINGICMGGKCECQINHGYVFENIPRENYYLRLGKCKSGRVPLGGKCSYDNACTKETNGSTCIGGLCGCEAGKILRNNRSCEGILGEGERCRVTGQCDKSKGLLCQEGECKCSRDFGIENATCTYGNVHHNGRCSNHSVCTNKTLDALCIGGLCRCPTGKELLNGSSCVGVLGHGEQCNETGQCKPNNHFVCQNHTCQCQTDYWKTGSTCNENMVPVGGPCTKDTACRKETPNAICNKYKCGCEDNATIIISPLNLKPSCQYGVSNINQPCNSHANCLSNWGVCENGLCQCAVNMGPVFSSIFRRTICVHGFTLYKKNCTNHFGCMQLGGLCSAKGNCECPADKTYVPNTMEVKPNTYQGGKCEQVGR